MKLTMTLLIAVTITLVAHAEPTRVSPVRDDRDRCGRYLPPLEKPEEGDHFGRAVAVGDFDGDGYADLAAGAPHESSGYFFQQTGVVLVFRGFPSGSTFTDPANNEHERVEFVRWQKLSRWQFGTQPAKTNDWFGHALAVGDFDGDGFDDLAIGAPGANSPIGDMTGRVFVAYGSSNGLGEFDDISPSDAGILPTGEDMFGWALAVGDLDGDELDDLAIGAPQTLHGDEYAGHVSLMRGSDDGLVNWTGVNQAAPHTAVTPAGIGTGEPLGTHETYDAFGRSLAIGDLDDDGRDDLVVGAPGDREGGPFSGAVYVFQSAPEGMRGWARLDQTGLDANEEGDGFGWSVAIGNFKSGSPYAHEIIVGAPFEDVEGGPQQVGRIYAFENDGGELAGLSALFQTGVSDNGAGDMFGYTLLAYKRLAYNWLLLVAAPGDNRNGLSNVGEVLPFGPTEVGPTDLGAGNPTDSTYFYGDHAEAHLGRSMAIGGPSNTLVIGHDEDESESGGVWYKPHNSGHENIYQDTMNCD